MAVWTEAGVMTLTNTGASATNAVAGMPGTPRAIIFVMVQSTALDTFTAHARLSIGLSGRSAADAITQAANARSDADTAATSDCGMRHRTDCVLIGSTTPGATFTEDGRASVAYDANGFTLTNATAFASAWRVGYFAVGGSDLTAAAVGETANQNATGNQDFTGPGFEPAFVMIQDIGHAVAAPSSSANVNQSLGWGNGTDNAVSWWRERDGVGTWRNDNAQNTSKILTGYGSGTSTTLVREATLSAMLSNGFRLNHTVANSNLLQWLAIAGGAWDMGTLTSSTSVNGTGDFASSVPVPRGAFIFGRNMAASAGISSAVVDGRLTFGALDEDGDEWSAWMGADSTDEDAATRISASKGIVHASASNTDVLDGEADLTFNGTDLRSTWTDADDAAKEVLCMVVGESAVTVTATVASITLGAFGQTLGTVATDSPLITLNAPNPATDVKVISPSGLITLDSLAQTGASIISTVGSLDLSVAANTPSVLALVQTDSGLLTLNAGTHIVEKDTIVLVSPAALLTLEAGTHIATATILTDSGSISLNAPDSSVKSFIESASAMLSLDVPNSAVQNALVSSVAEIVLSAPNSQPQVTIQTPPATLGLDAPDSQVLTGDLIVTTDSGTITLQVPTPIIIGDTENVQRSWMWLLTRKRRY